VKYDCGPLVEWYREGITNVHREELVLVTFFPLSWDSNPSFYGKRLVINCLIHGIAYAEVLSVLIWRYTESHI